MLSTPGPGQNLTNNKCVTRLWIGYFRSMAGVAGDKPCRWLRSSVLLVRHASLKCSGIEHTSDYSRTHEREKRSGGRQMTLIHEIPPRAATVRRPINRPGQWDRDRVAGSRKPAPSRPAGAPMLYRGGGVAMSVAPHRKRPVPLATTVGLALLAGIITFWLGLVAHFGQVANGLRRRCPRARPARGGAGGNRGIAAGCGGPGGARSAGSPGRRADPRTQRLELADSERGADADRAGRLTAGRCTAHTVAHRYARVVSIGL